jgi:peroxiredoxin Q/BCP
LVKLQADLPKIEGAGIQVIAISYDSVLALAKFSEKHKIAFPLLSDPDSKVITEFGVLNTLGKHKIERGTPHPGTFVLDRDGIVRAKLFRPGLDGIIHRHSVEDLLKAAQNVN